MPKGVYKRTQKHNDNVSKSLKGENHRNWGKREKRTIINCLNCEKKIEVYFCLIGRKKYCSKNCRETYWIKSKKFAGKNNPNYGNSKYTTTKEYDDFRQYKILVRSKTEIIYREYKHTINPNSFRRGGKGKYQLDHIIPISFGFKNGISINDISKKENLQMLTFEENQKKNDKVNF